MAERPWRPDASPPVPHRVGRSYPAAAPDAPRRGLGIPASDLPPLAVVASELTLEATAYEGRGRSVHGSIFACVGKLVGDLDTNNFRVQVFDTSCSRLHIPHPTLTIGRSSFGKADKTSGVLKGVEKVVDIARQLTRTDE